jgi:hypothetical protein
MPPSEPAAGNDLFISYSHIDNQPWGAGQRQWVSELHKELTTRLEQLLGRRVRVWRDDKLRGNDELTERVLSELIRSAAFVCVISPRYLKSEWCIREFEEYSRHTRVGGAGALKRLFKVVKTPVDTAQQPTAVKDLIGYDFFHETASGRVHEFSPSSSENSEESRHFWQKIDDLAQDIAPVVGSAGADDDRAASSKGRKTVYLAETTGDIKLARENIRRELGQRGYRVLPDRSLDRSLALHADELLPLIAADIADACLTVHPVGARYGFIPEGSELSIVELQIQHATARNGHCHHVIWVPHDAGPPSEEKQKDFIRRLRSDYTERAHTELLDQKPLEELKTRLVEKLETPPKPPPRSVTKGFRVYLICELADVQAVKPLEQYLRIQGFSVSLPLLEGSPEELGRDHRDTFVFCDAVLVYWGSARQAWLRQKQRDLWQAPGWGRTKDMRAQAIFVALPNTLEQAQCVADDFLVLSGRTEFTPEDLEPFVAQLLSTAGAQL